MQWKHPPYNSKRAPPSISPRYVHPHVRVAMCIARNWISRYGRAVLVSNSRRTHASPPSILPLCAFRRTDRYATRGWRTYVTPPCGRMYLRAAQSILFDLLARKSTGDAGAHICGGRILYTGISRVIMIRGTHIHRHTDTMGQRFQQGKPALGAIAREDARRGGPFCRTLDNGRECK